MGDTSSGKSSVLSAISGISFPSSDVLTTRCPTQLILTHASTFAGSVRLLRYQSSAADTSPKKIETLDDVTAAIEEFTQLLIDEGQVISDDAIEIKLQGPAFPNLTLTDLPGLVRTVRDDEDPAMIGRVRALVDRYLVQTRTIILAVVPANVDMHNTEILQAAEAADPDGTRTISIITKPDLIDDGAEQSVKELLLNTTKKRRLGYHMVKCRGQRALSSGVTIAKGREDEAAFFKTHPVWRTVDPGLVGTEKLAAKLSALLVEAIASAMPAVFTEIDAQMKACAVGLRAMGDAMTTPSARRAHYMRHVGLVTNRLAGATNGDYDDGAFFDTTSAASSVDNRLRAHLCVFDTKFQQEIEALSVVTTVNVDRSKEMPAVGDYVEVDAKNQNKWIVERVISVNGRSIMSAVSSPGAYTNYWRFIPTQDISELKQLLRENRGNELPLFVSSAMFGNIVRERFVTKWRAPMMTLFRAYETLLEGVAARVVSSTQANPRVQAHLLRVVKDVLSDLSETAELELEKVLATESRPYTLNGDLYESLQERRLQALQDGLSALSAGDETANVSVGAVQALMRAHGGTCNEDAQALDLHMAIAAYVDVAKTRFTDAIPMRLNSLVVDSVANTAAREKLEAQLASLKKAKAEIVAPTSL
ncbi:hypothetical protein SPRG_09673 [Saprolegnia parasitica CBS 223.65]|uniref:Dynamin-type G domain-containing protein n=1 Tax=Saprolegnia parasitica (strain CBS 223.65) TaxID=695850 RepID=A0A067C6Q1_SAPPC|nr:hypothetical protein SPRG_09673 [Saprolegnia parasitica CBS 223.65]KDO24840.1 hypothetical protein SPRG_09673 [Saprolegnia parasitica CBS 223.65]|eukprot:XP_012204487.1 hypothetical protein SPRG_09673 [Saprolegnia parasitica CBS 223.65]